MRTAILVSLAVLLGLMLAACDERESDKPVMEFTSDNYTLINKDNATNNCNLTVVLSGESGVTVDERIMFVYDHTQGLLVGDGSNQYAYTDSLGVAQAEFTVYDSTAGEVMISAEMDRFSTVNDRVILTVVDTPTMTITTTEDPVAGDGEVIIEITVALTSLSNNTVNQNVLFDSDLDIAYDSFPTNYNGVCTNQIHATNVEAGTYSLHVSLESFPVVDETIYFQLTNP